MKEESPISIAGDIFWQKKQKQITLKLLLQLKSMFPLYLNVKSLYHNQRTKLYPKYININQIYNMLKKYQLIVKNKKITVISSPNTP